MNPRFEINDKVLDPATGKTGFVSAVKHTSAGFEYDITWLAPTIHWGVYKDSIAGGFQRVETSCNKLMSPDDPYEDGS